MKSEILSPDTQRNNGSKNNSSLLNTGRGKEARRVTAGNGRFLGVLSGVISPFPGNSSMGTMERGDGGEWRTEHRSN